LIFEENSILIAYKPFSINFFLIFYCFSSIKNKSGRRSSIKLKLALNKIKSLGNMKFSF
jgi:hypothetical protein